MLLNFSSSLYYWAHYDFFNNTHLGEPIPNTSCDEIFTSWRSQKGWLRSPLNTLVYKQTSATQDVHCLYRFVTDKRLFARIILTIGAINFKVRHFYCRYLFSAKQKANLWRHYIVNQGYNWIISFMAVRKFILCLTLFIIVLI